MNKIQVLVLIAIVALVGYYFWQDQTKPQPKQTEEDLPADTILYDSPEWFPETQFLDSSQVLVSATPNSVDCSLAKDWFTEQHWLTDQEIDWALSQVYQSLPTQQAKYKVLEATQFMFAKEALESKDTEAQVSFPVLLSELTTQHDLVFIPVNNPNFHWSLLIYETKTKKFYHFDTLRGANDTYIKPLVSELLKQLQQTNEPDLTHFQTRYHLPQGNSWDCGIALIEIASQIMKDYPTYQRILMYTKLDFNFPQSRKNWSQKYHA